MARSRTSLSLSFGAGSRDEVASIGRASALAAVAARATNARREIFDAMAGPLVGLTSEPCGAESSGSSICPDYWTRGPTMQPRSAFDTSTDRFQDSRTAEGGRKYSFDGRAASGH